MLLRKSEPATNREITMRLTKIPVGAVVIGSDGVLAGTVDHVDGESIQLVEQPSKSDKPSRLQRSVLIMMVAKIEDGKVFLSTRADAAVMFEDHAKAPSWQQRTDRSPTR
jgi:hypothetical protein